MPLSLFSIPLSPQEAEAQSSVQELFAGTSKTRTAHAFLNSVSPGNSHCTYHLNQSCLSASNSRSSKFVLFLSFTFLVPPKRVWNPRANVLKSFRTALPREVPRKTLTKIPGEMQDRSVGLGEFVLFKPSVRAEIFQHNSYQANVKIIIALNTQMPARQFPPPMILTVQPHSWGGRRESLSPHSLGRGKPC